MGNPGLLALFSSENPGGQTSSPHLLRGSGNPGPVFWSPPALPSSSTQVSRPPAGLREDSEEPRPPASTSFRAPDPSPAYSPEGAPPEGPSPTPLRLRAPSAVRSARRSHRQLRHPDLGRVPAPPASPLPADGQRPHRFSGRSPPGPPGPASAPPASQFRRRLSSPGSRSTPGQPRLPAACPRLCREPDRLSDLEPGARPPTGSEALRELALGAGSTRPRLDLDSGIAEAEYTTRRGLVLGKRRGQNFGLRGTRLVRDGGGAFASGFFWLSLAAAWRRSYEFRCSSEIV